MADNLFGELISFKNKDGYCHDGIFFYASHSTKTIIHVHGSYGNFYQQRFVRTMAKHYLAAGFNFLSFNLTCHDGFGDAYYNENFKYTGGALSDFSSCVQDIQAAIEFVAPFSSQIILQGHSLGCDRVVHYLLTTGNLYDFILLSPCDSYRLQTILISPETVEHQIERLKKGNKDNDEFDWLPLNEYGVKQGEGWTYPNPITRKAFLSILQGPPFYLFRMDQPMLYYINSRCFVYIGGKDLLQTSSPEIVSSFFKERVESIQVAVVQEGDHGLESCEDSISNLIVEWIRTQKKETQP